MTRLAPAAGRLLEEAVAAAGNAQPPRTAFLRRLHLQLPFVPAVRSGSPGVVLSQTVNGRAAACAWLTSVDFDVLLDRKVAETVVTSTLLAGGGRDKMARLLKAKKLNLVPLLAEGVAKTLLTDPQLLQHRTEAVLRGTVSGLCRVGTTVDRDLCQLLQQTGLIALRAALRDLVASGLPHLKQLLTRLREQAVQNSVYAELAVTRLELADTPEYLLSTLVSRLACEIMTGAGV